ncbi:MAG TPA: ABC transporter permease [Vicinamibacterales bacterium]
MLADLRFRLRALLRRAAVEHELDEELAGHLAHLEQQWIAEGLDPVEARRRARLALGGLDQTREACRDARGTRYIEDLARDLRYAWRALTRKPALLATAVLSLALGIGANTVVFGIVSAVVLHPLAVPDAGRIVAVNGSGGPSHSFPNYRDIRDRSTSFDDLFAYRIAPMALELDGPATRAWGLIVTGNYFGALGLAPAAGRLITRDDDGAPGESPYVILGYDLWQSRFGGDPSIIGRRLHINQHPYTVIGVAPRGFHGVDVFYRSEVWVPMAMQPQVEGWSWLDSRTTWNAWIAGRLKPGVSLADADAELGVIAAQLAREHRENEGLRLSVSPAGLAGAYFREPVEAFGRGVLLLAALVLLAACVNLASLFSARIGERQRELSIRIAIGAGRWRVVRQLLAEAVIIAVLGGAAAVALAAGLLDLLSRWRAHADLPVQVAVDADWRVLAFGLGVGLLTVLVFGVVPALRGWQADPNAGLKGPAGAGPQRRWLGEGLLAIQVALCAVLVTASLVAVRGLVASFKMPVGFEPDGLAAATVELDRAGYDQARGLQFQQRALERVASLPGVRAAAWANSIPLTLDQSTSSFYTEGETDFRPANALKAMVYNVSPGFFRTVGARLRAGREFTPGDREGSVEVAIVNEAFAERLFGTVQAVGRRFRHGGGPPIAVVGVVESGKYRSLTEPAQPVVFWPAAQKYNGSTMLLARTARPEGDVAREIRDILVSLDPELPVYGTGSARQNIGLVYVPAVAAAWALGAFGLLAVMLACTGVYGLSSGIVARRARELAIRRAIGAQSRQVLDAVFRRIGGALGLGAAAGLAGILAARPLLAHVVHGASPGNPLVIAGAVMLLLLTGILSASGPARRALRLDPMRELRQD